MTDPQRLLFSDATEFERQLLGGAAFEVPSPQLTAKMLSAIGGTSAAAGAALSLAASGSKTLPTASAVAWKWVVSTVAVGAVGSGLWLVDSGASGPVAGSAVESPPAAVAAAGDPAAVAAPPVVAAESELNEIAVEPKQVQSLTAKSSNKKRAAAVNPLGAELKLLDEARGALAREDAGRALALLRRYGKRFPAGILQQEATVLKVRALEIQGREREAASLKNSFIESHPNSAHNQRLERER